ncbi:MAG: uroporphyrinogen decarboxylase family protein [Eubacteriales bacterium]|nr:uroporphyrinogen decarboxylase family protein [Eubacteriales bacterium]
MTSRERVLCALNHQPTDRVPMDLFGMACSIVDPAYFRLREYLGLTDDVEPFRKGANCSYYDERILDAFEIDIRRVFAKFTDAFPKTLPDGSFMNEWGIVQKKGKFGVEFVKHPLQDAELEDIEAYPWPKAKDFLDVSKMREQAEKLHRENQYAIAVRAPMNGIFEIGCWLRGMQEFMMDMYEEPEITHAICEKILEVQLEVYGMILDEVGEFVDIVETGDDYGSQNALLISPNSLKEFILPRRKRLNDMIHRKAPHAKVFLHCCGSIAPIIDDLVDCGVDILNPVQTMACNMDPYMLKEKFGDRIVFHGGVDTQKALRGNAEDVAAEVSHMLDALNHNGGYILSSCNHIQSDVSPENICELFKAAKELSMK